MRCDAARLILFRFRLGMWGGTADRNKLFALVLLLGLFHTRARRPGSILIGGGLNPTIANALLRASIWSSFRPLGNEPNSSTNAAFHLALTIETFPTFT